MNSHSLAGKEIDIKKQELALRRNDQFFNGKGISSILSWGELISSQVGGW
jgi:hypothetical protein